MRRNRNTKIIATLGPASSTADRIRALFEGGADVFRLNGSHGTHEDHAARIALIRALEKEVCHPIAVLFDLQGPKIRLGTFAGGEAELLKGQGFVLDRDVTPGDNHRVCLPHPEIFAVIQPGHALLIDDGKLRLRVLEVLPGKLMTEVEVGGPVRDRKGVNIPDATLPISAMTEKDRADLAFALEQGVDWVALSFVQRPEDIDELRAIVGDRAALMAKLEKPAALQHLEAIVSAADAVMVARGDLGVELPAEDVPVLQRQIVRTCRALGKPVVVATQMLESMHETPTPTRAEASDVATAVYEGVDAIMLSGESAFGKYPIEAVSMMDRIISRVEQDPLHRQTLMAIHAGNEHTVVDAISAAILAAANTLPLAATVAYTTSGKSCIRIAHERPPAAVLGLTPSADTGRRLALVWGVHPVVTDDALSVEDMVGKAIAAAVRHGYANDHQPIAVVAGVPFGQVGSTNTLHIAYT